MLARPFGRLLLLAAGCEASFCGHRQQILTSSTGLMTWLSSGFATNEPQDRRTTPRLKSESAQRVVVGEFVVAGLQP